MRLLLIALVVACGGTPSQLGPPDCESLHSRDVLSAHSIKRFPGLVGSVNPNRAPEGAAEIAQDVVHRSVDTAEPRRGYKASSSLGHPLNAIAFKQGKLIALTYNTPSNTGALSLYDPATDVWSNLPMNPGGLLIDRPGISGAHTRFVSANKALYFQSAYGLTKVEDVSTGVCRAAIQPKLASSAKLNTIGLTYNSVTSQSNNWLADTYQVAYRATIARYGANKELIESEPSDRLIVTNTSGAPGVPQVGVSGVQMVPAGSFLRFYRTASVPGTGTLSDECFLVGEIVPGSSSVLDANGYYSLLIGTVFLDQASDSSLTVPLYTNPQTGDGIQNADTPVALAGDMAWFKNRLHTLNTSDVQRLAIKIIGTGTGGLSDGDWITINGFKFTFRATPVATTDVQLSTGGTTAANLENTARDLAYKVNRGYFGASNLRVYSGGLTGSVQVSYLSLSSTDAGQLLVQSVLPGSPTITIKTSSSAGWDRDYSAGYASDPNAQAAGWMYSLFGEPEAVPTANEDLIGDPTATGYRLIALKDTLFAFKQDGLWKITDDGSTVGPSVQLVDPTIHLVAPESAVAVDNMIFALCDQGVVKITETGAVENISHLQIERDLFKLMGYVGATNLAETSFGVAYLPEHTYILCLPESPNATSCTKEYVYNLQSGAWSSWNIPGGVISGTVHPDTGQLYFGRSDGTLCIERKDFASTDYQDPGFTIASPATTATASLVFSGDKTQGTNTIAVGDIIQQPQATYFVQQKVTGVSYASGTNQTTVTLDAVPTHPWSNATNLNVVKAIQSQVKFLPIHADEPLTDKDWGDCYLSFRYCDMDALSVGFASEKFPMMDTAVERVNNADGSAAPLQLGAWGASPWGQAIWGRQAKDVTLKCSMPQDLSKSAQLTLSLTMPCALSRFELAAIDVKIAGATDRVVR